ncbi:hypothetical protein T492DRAFT_865292, partial [Pavlovales sp. CCMP2436]
DLANTAWAFATLGISEPRLFDAIAREAVARASEQCIGDFKAQNVANTAWAYAIVGVATRGVLVKAVNARAASIGIDALSLVNRMQLHQFFLSVEPELRLPAELLAPIGLRDVCTQAMADEPTASSKLHLEVSAELTRMGISHANELCVPKLGYHVDIAILPITNTAVAEMALLDDKVAARAREAVRAATVTYGGLVIEVDGPSHYDAARRLLPAIALIRRHLALVGCAVVVDGAVDLGRLLVLLEAPLLRARLGGAQLQLAKFFLEL